MQDSKRKRLRIVMCAVGLASLGVCCFFAWNIWGGQNFAPATPVKVAHKEKKEGAPKKQLPDTARQKTGETPPVRQVYNSSSTLGDLSRYRGQKILLEQQVRIAELEQRLKDISAPKKQPEIVLPDLVPPKATPAVPVSVQAPKRGPAVVSVHGVTGDLSASIRTSDGKVVTVKNGGQFGGGVLHVTRKSVSIRRNGKLSTIPFE